MKFHPLKMCKAAYWVGRRWPMAIKLGLIRKVAY